MRCALLVTVLLFGASAVAQNANNKAPVDKDLWVTKAQMEAIKAKATDPTSGAPGAFSARLWDAGNASTAYIRLTKPDTPHAHGEWSEVFLVVEGSGTLETGGTLVCPCGGDSAVHKDIFTQAPAPKRDPAAAPRKVNPFDKAGTSIEGGVKQSVKAGDMVFVPAGVNHVWTQLDSPVVYFDVKFPLSAEIAASQAAQSAK